MEGAGHDFSVCPGAEEPLLGATTSPRPTPALPTSACPAVERRARDHRVHREPGRVLLRLGPLHRPRPGPDLPAALSARRPETDPSGNGDHRHRPVHPGNPHIPGHHRDRGSRDHRGEQPTELSRRQPRAVIHGRGLPRNRRADSLDDRQGPGSACWRDPHRLRPYLAVRREHGPLHDAYEISATKRSSWLYYDHNSLAYSGDGRSTCPDLDDVVEGDQVKVSVILQGAESYSSLGGWTNVPHLEIYEVEVL